MSNISKIYISVSSSIATEIRVPTGPETLCKVLKNEERKIRPWKVLKLDIGPEKMLIFDHSGAEIN